MKTIFASEIQPGNHIIFDGKHESYDLVGYKCDCDVLAVAQFCLGHTVIVIPDEEDNAPYYFGEFEIIEAE